MALNEMIAQGAQFKMPDPLEQYGRIAQIQQAQNQNALAQYQLGSAQRGDVQQNALYRRLQDPTFSQDNPEQLASLAQFGTPGIAAIKSLTEAKNAALTGSKLRGDVQEQQRKSVDRMMLGLSDDPSDEKINSFMQSIEADPTFSAAAKSIVKNGLSGMLGMSIDERKKSLSMSGMTAAERFAATKPQVVGAGASLMVPGSTVPLYTQPALPTETTRLQAERADLIKAGVPTTDRRIQELDQKLAVNESSTMRLQRELQVAIANNAAPAVIAQIQKDIRNLHPGLAMQNVVGVDENGNQIVTRLPGAGGGPAGQYKLGQAPTSTARAMLGLSEVDSALLFGPGGAVEKGLIPVGKLTPSNVRMFVAAVKANPGLNFTNLSEEQVFGLAQAKAQGAIKGKQVLTLVDQTTAQNIANGNLPPAKGPNADKIMNKVMEIDPNFKASDYGLQTAAVKAFNQGIQGNKVRSLNVVMEHFNTLEKAADALQSGDVRAINAVSQFIQTQTGKPAPSNFNAVKEILADEIVAAVVPGVGALADRVALKKTILASASPEQLKGVVAQYKELIGGQLTGLEKQYQAGTGRSDFKSRYLTSAAVQGLAPSSQYVETKVVNGRTLGKKADGTVEEIK
jgi:hypothetical protein